MWTTSKESIEGRAWTEACIGMGVIKIEQSNASNRLRCAATLFLNEGKKTYVGGEFRCTYVISSVRLP